MVNEQKSVISKSRAGRPPLGRDARTITIAVKVSANELELWERMAKEANMGLRTFMLYHLRKMTKGK